MMRFTVFGLAALLVCFSDAAVSWPPVVREMKPWVYNWWMGSAVDARGLSLQCRELAEKGFGGFHVIPIYGVLGKEREGRKFLSEDWLCAWNEAVDIAQANGLGVDLTMGAGWCFGGPWVTERDAASSKMKVKRASACDSGYMLDPFSATAMSNHVARFEAAFGNGGTARRPRAFYHDSYEYYGARPRDGQDVDGSQIACFKVWTEWCRNNGYLTRNEGHGAPANWLDLYALSDIPETEMFGTDDQDVLVSKFASSAAHVAGRRLVSAEAGTWLDEHFRERPEEIKRLVDRFFLAGVNHLFYHGLCYSPTEETWPGWCFYASLEMNPRNPIWREMKALNDYVTRCQSLFQTWEPDNDLAVVWDAAVARRQGHWEMSIHNREKWFYGGKVGKLARALYDRGYCFDYISPRQLAAGKGARYAEVVDPEKDELPKIARRESADLAGELRFTRWKKDGRRMLFLVNESKDTAKVLMAESPFDIMDPLTGETGSASCVRIAPGHSVFAIDLGTCRVEACPPEGCVSVELKGTWTVSPVCGGPAFPAATNLTQLVSWTKWDEAFSGTMRYACHFACKGKELRTIDLSEVHEISRVRLNGKDLGVRFMPPYRYDLPSGVLREGDNLLEVEVTGLGSNRLRWNDVNGVPWKKFSDINMVDSAYRPLDAAKYPLMPNGLMGPVHLLGFKGTSNRMGTDTPR